MGRRQTAGSTARASGAPHGQRVRLLGFFNAGFQGLRFVNEDIPGLQIHEQLETLPDKTAWQFVDSNWRQQIPHVYLSHGTVSYVIEDEKFDSGEVFAGLNTTDNIVSPRLIEAAREAVACCGQTPWKT